MGHRWRHRPNRFSSLRYVCQNCWSVVVGWTGFDKPPADLKVPGPMHVEPANARYTCEELVVLNVHEY